jgi:hypothetical protein
MEALALIHSVARANALAQAVHIPGGRGVGCTCTNSKKAFAARACENSAQLVQISAFPACACYPGKAEIYPQNALHAHGAGCAQRDAAGAIQGRQSLKPPRSRKTADEKSKLLKNKAKKQGW